MSFPAHVHNSVKSSSFKVKILEEKIPKSYDDLRQKIAEVVTLNDVVVEDRDKFRSVIPHTICAALWGSPLRVHG